ncbi:MAG: hypothetical protein LC799_04520 [Actinobacteria bacterium]|nr:hypothetical protein [Actinomycetota bacterium]
MLSVDEITICAGILLVPPAEANEAEAGLAGVGRIRQLTGPSSSPVPWPLAVSRRLVGDVDDLYSASNMMRTLDVSEELHHRSCQEAAARWWHVDDQR